MRDASVGLIARLAIGSTTLARLWVIQRTDGVVKRFTDHDVDIVLGGNTYYSTASFTPQAVVSQASKGVSNSEVTIVFTGDANTGFNRTDVLIGVYDNAVVTFYLCDWQHPEYGTMTYLAGRLGTMVVNNNKSGSVSISGLLSKLDRILGERFSAECRADLGDKRCTIDLDGGVPGGKAQTVLTLQASGGIFAYKNAQAGETVTIDTRTYTWRASVGVTANEVLIGSTGTDSINALKNAVNGGPGSGTLYGSATTPHASASAAGTGLSLTFTALVAGSAGNALVSTETMAYGSFTGATFSGGRDVSNLRTTAAITAVTSAAEVTVTPDASITAGFLTLGMILWDPATSNANTSMEILVDSPGAGSDHILHFALAMPILPLVGDTVVLYAGCDKLFTTCDTKFHNTDNFRGEPGIPGSDAQQATP